MVGGHRGDGDHGAHGHQLEDAHTAAHGLGLRFGCRGRGHGFAGHLAHASIPRSRNTAAIESATDRPCARYSSIGPLSS